MARSDYTPPTFVDVPNPASPPAGAVALDAAHVNAMAQAIGKSAYGYDINVKDYGAKGDGTTNDGPAIQNAINAALAATPTSNSGGAFAQAARVVFPAGRYRIATPLVVNMASANTTTEARRRLSLIGEGDGHTVLLVATTSGTYGLSVRNGALTMRGMTLVGNGTTGAYGLNLGADDGDSAGFVNQFRIEDVTFRSMYRFVNLVWAFDGQFNGVGFTDLVAGGVGFNVATHSSDNCNNVHFYRCHWEPATGGGTMFKAVGAVSAARGHAAFSFTGCHFESRSFATTLVHLEIIARVTFVDVQFTQNADPGTAAPSAAVPAIRIINAPQVSFTGCSIIRDTGTGFAAKLLSLGGQNRGLVFASCFFYLGDVVGNAGKAAVWQSDASTAFGGSPTPFRLIASNINDASGAAEVPDEVHALANPNTTAEMWTQRFDPTSKRLVFGYGAGGGDWASGRSDLVQMARDGGVVVPSYLAWGNMQTVAAGGTASLGYGADNNANRVGLYIVVADGNVQGAGYALVYTTGSTLYPVVVGAQFAAASTDPGTANAFNLFVSGVSLQITNRTGASARVTALPIGFANY